MAKQKRIKSRYPGVFHIESKQIGTDKPDKIFYIRYKRCGKTIEEKAGRSSQDMTPAKANQIRARRISGAKSNEEKRQAEKEEKNRLTVSKLWAEYKRHKPDLKGIVSDENRMKNYIIPAFGDKIPSEIVPLDVDRLRLKILKNRKPATAKNVLELFRRVLNFGINKNLIRPLSFKIEIPKVNNLKTEDLTPEELNRLLQVINEDHHPQAGNFMLLALYSGMRRGEMFRLKWSDIDFEKGFIKILDPKGGIDQTIPLSDAAENLLKSIPIDSNSPFVFPGRNGKQRTCIKKPVNRIKKAAGLPDDFRPLHGLRHVYASMLASSGKVDMYTLQKLLTHKSPMMTQRYAHLRDESLKNATNLISDMISHQNEQNIIKMVKKN